MGPIRGEGVWPATFVSKGEPPERLLATLAAVTETADDNHIQLGDIVTLDLGELGDANWQVVGFYRVIFGGGFATDSIYAPQEAVFAATKKYSRGEQLFVRTRFHSENHVEAMTDQLEDFCIKRETWMCSSAGLSMKTGGRAMHSSA